MPSRRRFFQWAGAGAAASLAARNLAAEPASATGATKHTFELGLASYTLREFPLDKVILMTKRVGLKHLCLHPLHLKIGSPADKIADAVAKIKAAGIDLYASGVIYMEKPVDVESGFKYAKALGIRTIVGRPTPALLPLVNEKVQQYDIAVAIHNHGPGDKVFPLPDTAYQAIKNLDRRVGLCIDIGHTMRGGVDPSEAALQCADRILDIHMKDVSSATAKGTCIEAGRGVIDIPKFVRTMERIGYKGILSFEYEKDGKDPMPGLCETAGYVRGVMAVV